MKLTREYTSVSGKKRTYTYDYRPNHQRNSQGARVMESAQQRAAIVKLVGFCEGLVNVGALGDTNEMQLRQRIADTLTAFRMPSLSERAPPVPLQPEPPQSFQRTLDAIAEVIR